MGKDCAFVQEWIVPSELGREKEVAENLAQTVQDCSALKRPRIEEMKTAVAEAVLNAIEHGNGMDPRKKVKVRLCCSEAEVVVTAYDQGAGFTLQPPLRQGNIGDDHENPRGWGMFLICSFSKRVKTGWEQGSFFVQMHF
jgi:serine/threonine-protein kinase RsbW